MQKVKSIRDANVSGKRVLLRVDFNVPIANGAVLDDTRIKAILPTVDFLLKQGAGEIILLTHLGRPAGSDPQFSLAPVVARLKTYIDTPQVHLHENLRFDAGEEENDPGFARTLAGMGEVFINDAFAVSHRAHASIVGVTKLLPSYAGLLMEEEIAKLSQALMPPQGSLAIIGGAKFETKIPLIKKLLTLYDPLLVGGALGNDLLKARGLPVGASLVSSTPVPESIARDERLLVPTDVAVEDTETHMGRSALTGNVRTQESIFDIGPTTAHVWSTEVARAPFVLWNGPMGAYERGFVEGTNALAQALVRSNVSAVVGGGDTVAALQKFSLAAPGHGQAFDPKKVFISTGGGAMLEFLAKGTLVGIEALKN